MIRILSNDGIHADGKGLLEEANYQVDVKKVSQEDLPKELPNYDVIIVRSATKVRKELIDKCPNLKIIARGGVGLDNIDVEYARQKGITVMNTPAASSQAVAELTFGHIFALARFLHHSNRVMPQEGRDKFKQLKKDYATGTQLRNKTLGIIGVGRIGQESARIGLALGMKVMPVDLVVDRVDVGISLFQSNNVQLGVTLETHSMEEVLAQSDFLTLHVPYSGGRPILSAEELAKLKKGAFVINTSRGGAIDEEALLEALNSGHLGGAGLDVFEDEPKPRQALLNHPKVSVSPHIGASTLEAQANIGLELADKIIAFFGDDK
jgi:D-3-phosphoglycerate dehydrogenase